MIRPFFKPYRYDRPQGRPRNAVGVFVVMVLLALGSSYYFLYRPSDTRPPMVAKPTPGVVVKPAAGQLLSIEARMPYTASQAQAVARENYGSSTLAPLNGATKITFRYRSTDLDGKFITLYGRAYVPSSGGKHPIFAFAPGTTGIGDQCSASLENPKVANWANYDSHMLMYASQGYAAVTTDYEGMRDPSRIHHYMVGELEGRALLDAIRALKSLPEARGNLDRDHIVMGGYSQGGHAAFWADSIASTYAPELSIKGVVGFGPVMSVKESISDVAFGSTLNWFGPYVLTSYTDYYQKDYGLARIFQPKYLANLRQDVLSHCIDTDIAYWGHNPNAVYTPEFLTSINSFTFDTDYPDLAEALGKNATGNATTSSAKLINQGKNDNVVLPRQQEAVMPGMCASSVGPVQYKLYNATHYSMMIVSLRDTLNWMKQLEHDQRPTSTCPAS